MKTKLYRVLVMLLAIAMMIPSFAMAEVKTVTEAKLTITGADKTIEDVFLVKGDAISPEKNTVKYFIEVPSNAANAQIDWKSSNTDVVTIGGNFPAPLSAGYVSPEAGETLTLCKQGFDASEVTITGTLSVDSGKVVKTVSFKVKVTSKDIEKIAFKSTDKTYKFNLSDKSHDFSNDIAVTPEDYETTTSFHVIDWEISAGDDCANIDVDGNMTFVKAGTVTLKAKVHGSAVAADTATVTILDNSKEEQDSDPAKAYTELRFTAKNFVLPYELEEDSSVLKAVNLMDPQYLQVYPADLTSDRLVWEVVDKPEIAQITSDDKSALIQFNRKMVGEAYKVTVRVHSKNNPDLKAECTVWVKAPKDDQQVKTIKFNPNSTTVAVGQKIKVDDYVTITPTIFGATYLEWRSNDNDVAKVYYSNSSYVIEATGEGTAVITARSYDDASVYDKFTVNVVKKATKPVKTLKFAETELEFREGNSNLPWSLSTYLVEDPDDHDDTLIWTSDDPTVINFTNSSYGSFNFGKNAKAGMSAKISVRNVEGTVKTETPLTIKIVKAPSKPVTALKFSQDELIVKKSAGKINLGGLYLIPTPIDSDEKLIWTSSAPSVAKVAKDDENGIVYLNNIGEATINVRNEDNTVKTEKGLVIKVVKDEDAYTEITPTEKSVKIDASIDLADYITTKGNIAGLDKLVWTSSNQQILSFPTENSGATKLNPNKIGKVTVTVRNTVEPIIKCTFEVEVTDNRKPIQKIELTQETFELEPEGKIYLGRYIVTDPVDYVGDALIFTSDDPSVVVAKNMEASYDAMLLEDGEAHITVRTEQGAAEPVQFTIKLKAKGAESIEFKDAPKTFYGSASYDLDEKVDKEGKTHDDVTVLDLKDYLVTKPAEYVTAKANNLVWDSSDPTVATVDGGVVTYVNAGTVTITVTDKISGKSAKVELTLKEKHPVESIALKNIKMEVGENYDLTKGFITYTPANADIDLTKIIWTSSNREVAEVQETANSDRDVTTGKAIVAYKAGKTTITANYEREDGTFVKAKCTVTVKDVKLEDVKFAQSKYTLKLNSKLEAKIRFNLEPFNCSYEEGDIYVISSKNDVVSVSPVYVDPESHKGYVTITAKAPGDAWVTVKRSSNDKVLDACKVVVKAVKVKSVKWKEKSLKLYWYNDGITEHYDSTKTNTVYKNSVDVKPIIQPANAYCKVTFETTDPGVAFVNDQSRLNFQNAMSSGKPLPPVTIEAVGPGACKIVVKVDDGKKVRKASLDVEVETKKIDLKISQSKATLKLEKGSDVLYLRAYDADTDKDVKVKWTSSNTKVAKVNVDGKVRAVGAGTATITATTKEGQKLTVKCKVTVKAPSTENEAAKKITGDTKVTVKAGEKKALEIKVKPEGAKVTFTSSDSKIVKVTKDGTIKGIKAGKATITVKAAEGKAELKIKVTVK